MSLDRVDIERVLQRLGIEAKRKGREWYAKCPNPEHDDHDPSWRIRDDPGATRHGYHRCWPCGFGGGLVSLVQKVKGIESSGDARAWIAGEVPTEQREVVGVEIQVRAPRLRFELPEEVLFEPLAKWPTPARREIERRGIQDWQVDRWGIGYAVDGRLKGRVVYVLRDVRGRPRGYSARTFVGEGRRFLEPDDWERADPTALFGEQHWPYPIDRTAVFVFEGAAKALAAEAALPGTFVAATTGSEVRPLHALKLTTFQRVCLVGDDDEAGDRVSSTLYAQLCRHASPERLVLRADADELPSEELGGILLGWLRR